MALQKNKFRLGSGNLYLKEGSPLAFVLAGFVANISLTIGAKRVNLTGGQTADSVVDRVSTGVDCMLDGEFEEVTLESYMRAMRGNTLLHIDNTTSTKRRLEIVAGAGQSMLALAQEVKFVPLVGGAETTNLEEIFVIPLATASGQVKAPYNWQNKTVIPFSFEGLVDSDTRDRIIYFGDSTAVATTPVKTL